MNVIELFTRQRCCHTTLDGAQCKSHPPKGRQYCFFHDPERAEERKAASRSGGEANRKASRWPLVLPPNSLESLSDIAALMRESLTRCRHGEIKAHDLTAISYASTVLVSLMEKDERRQEKAQRSVAADAFLKTVFPNYVPAAEQGIAAHPTQEQKTAEQGTNHHETNGQPTANLEFKKDRLDELAALMLADVEPPSENLKPEIADIRKPAQLEVIDNQQIDIKKEKRFEKEARFEKTKEPEKTNTESQPSPALLAQQPVAVAVHPAETGKPEITTAETTRHQDLAWRGAPLEFLEISRSVLAKEAANQSAVAAPNQTANGAGSAEITAASAIAPPAPEEQEPVRRYIDPDDMRSPIPGLKMRHINYMKYAGTPVANARRPLNRIGLFRGMSPQEAYQELEHMRRLGYRLPY
ncbi:MAG TPA: hypothetical protein VK699_04535 [Terriglobales bacterium]|jgi:hypothetical protein|nr:hypothetical protein [Terriglobales bacterium]